MDAEKVKEFLTELGKLTDHYGIEIGGCGCCGSPFLMEAENGKLYACDSEESNLAWVNFCTSDQICGEKVRD